MQGKNSMMIDPSELVTAPAKINFKFDGFTIACAVVTLFSIAFVVM
jgi:hypothetical protein